MGEGKFIAAMKVDGIRQQCLVIDGGSYTLCGLAIDEINEYEMVMQKEKGHITCHECTAHIREVGKIYNNGIKL